MKLNSLLAVFFAHIFAIFLVLGSYHRASGIVFHNYNFNDIETVAESESETELNKYTFDSILLSNQDRSSSRSIQYEYLFDSYNINFTTTSVFQLTNRGPPLV